MSEYLLGIDIGTSACKVALFDCQGQVIAEQTGAYIVRYPRPGWAEQDADEWWVAVCSAIKALFQNCSIQPSDIVGIGVDGQSWSAILIDREGRVLAPNPIWTDTRAQDVCQQLAQEVSPEELFALCGNPLQPSYTLPKVLWYRQNEPEVYDRAYQVLQANSFIVYRLTGRFTQDLSQGYGYACFDIRQGCWNEEMCRRLKLDQSLLPDIYPCHSVVGGVTAEAARLTGLCAGTPVVAGGLDAACGTLGAGVLYPGQTQEQGGQAGGMSICLEACAADPRLILSFHVVPGRWLLQGGTTGGGGALKWLRETICPEWSFAQMSEAAQAVPPGSNGVCFLPYLSGERSPIWNPNACGVFFGLNYAKTRAHLIRAVMEGTAYALRHNLETAQAANAELGVLRAVGGSANSQVWTQIKADVTQRAIQIPTSDMATTWGAAILAGVGVGAFEGFAQAVDRSLSITREHQPCEALRALYDNGYQRYRELYQRLKPMMKELKQF